MCRAGRWQVWLYTVTRKLPFGALLYTYAEAVLPHIIRGALIFSAGPHALWAYETGAEAESFLSSP